MEGRDPPVSGECPAPSQNQPAIVRGSPKPAAICGQRKSATRGQRKPAAVSGQRKSAARDQSKPASVHGSSKTASVRGSPKPSGREYGKPAGGEYGKPAGRCSPKPSASPSNALSCACASRAPPRVCASRATPSARSSPYCPQGKIFWGVVGLQLKRPGRGLGPRPRRRCLPGRGSKCQSCVLCFPSSRAHIWLVPVLVLLIRL